MKTQRELLLVVVLSNFVNLSFLILLDIMCFYISIYHNTYFYFNSYSSDTLFS